MTEITDSFLMSSYLKEVKKRSDGTFENSKVILGQFFRYIEQTRGKKSIKDITMLDVRDFFVEYLDVRPLKIATKNVKRFMLTSFFNYIQKVYLASDITFSNPVPNSKIYNFTKKDDDIKRYSKTELKILSQAQLSKILDFVYNNMTLRDFVLILLITCTGARISEIRTILIDDVNIDRNFFETGFIKNARKSTLYKGQGLIFFFPNAIKKYLRQYLDNRDKTSKWLFPGYLGKSFSQSAANGIYYYITKKIGIKFTWHWFRKTIITERMEINCPLWTSEGLMNHASSSVEGESYIKLSVEKKFKLYLKYFPYKKVKYIGNTT